jgi:hypothetical protein
MLADGDDSVRDEQEDTENGQTQHAEKEERTEKAAREVSG